jgi:hypothetical protein
MKSILHTWLIPLIWGRSSLCAPERLRLGRLLRKLSPSSLYSLYTRLWLSFHPSLRNKVKIRSKPYRTRIIAISRIRIRMTVSSLLIV